MRVRTTILLLLAMVAAAFVYGLHEVRRLEAARFASVAAAREGVWKNSVREFLDRQGAPLAKLVEHHSSLAETLPAVLRKDMAWAREAFDDRTLGSFGANACWIYLADGSHFFSHANVSSEILRTLPVETEVLTRLFARGEPLRFHLALPGAARAEAALRVLEVRGAPVRPAWDHDAATAPLGWLFAGRIWDQQMLRDLPLLSGDDRIALLPTGVEPEEASAPSTMLYVQDLRDAQGRSVGRLVVTNRSPTLALLDSRGERLATTLTLGVLILFGLLFLLLSWSIVRPLRLVIRGLHTRDLAPLEPLCTKNTEFGELARMLNRFFAQRAELVREMNERVATEKALRTSEEMLRHSQKMEAVGRLAGGVAHDFNNLLTAIIGYADLLRSRLADDPSGRQAAQLIHQAGEQAAGLTRQLLAFSRKQLLQPRVIDINVIITNLHRLLQRIIGEHIEIRVQPEAACGCVRADPGQIEQVIVNLGVNARDAMPRGGVLLVRTGNVVLDGSGPPDVPPGEYVTIEVTDSGEGMDAETKARIFEPFFTTKGPSQGTGLGLATVYGIVRQSGGGIVVESERGRGSTFRIFLPREYAEIEVAATPPLVPLQAPRAETILVVEDEEIVRELVCEVLRSHGYRVIGTDRGAEAVRLVREEACTVDLLISDVVMPEMNGVTVAQMVRELSPEVRVLFVSGYSEKDMADQGMEALSFEVLQKPFTPGALVSKVRETMDGPAVRTRE